MQDPHSVSTALLTSAEAFTVIRNPDNDRFLIHDWGSDTPLTEVTAQVQDGLAATPPLLALSSDPDGNEYATLTDAGHEELRSRQNNRYPPTIWSRYRETALPRAIALLFATLAMASRLDLNRLADASILLGALVLMASAPALYLENRADRKYDRDHPASKGARA